MKKYPEPCIGAFIRNKKGQILLTRSYKWQNGKKWVVPGGHIDWGETIEQAVKREVKEEVGVKVDFLQVFVMWEVLFPKEFHQKKHFLFIECECLVKDGEKIQVDNREIQAAAWFSLKEALKQDLEKWTRKAIEVLVRESA